MEHHKGVVNDIMANNFYKIRLGFEKLREEVRRKEEEVLGEYQQIVEQQMDRI